MIRNVTFYSADRVDESTGVLKFFDGASQTLIPVCGNLWDVRNNQKICDLLGKGWVKPELQSAAKVIKHTPTPQGHTGKIMFSTTETDDLLF